MYWVYMLLKHPLFLTPKKVEEMMITELTSRGKQVLDEMEKIPGSKHPLYQNPKEGILQMK